MFQLPLLLTSMSLAVINLWMGQFFARRGEFWRLRGKKRLCRMLSWHMNSQSSHLLLGRKRKRKKESRKNLFVVPISKSSQNFATRCLVSFGHYSLKDVGIVFALCAVLQSLLCYVYPAFLNFVSAKTIVYQERRLQGIGDMVPHIAWSGGGLSFPQ